MFQKYYIVMVTLLLIALLCSEAKLTLPVKNTSRTNSDIVLLSSELSKNFILKIPKKCEELGICEHVPNYPQRLVFRIIKKLLKKNITFNRDEEQWEDNRDFFEGSSSIQDDEELCKSKPKLYYPQAARDVSKRWHLILNSAGTPQNFIGEYCELELQHLVRVNLVFQKSRAFSPIFWPKYPDCSKMAHFSKPFYQGACVQKFTKRVMYGLNDQLIGVVKTLFDVPSCCACVARRT